MSCNISSAYTFTLIMSLPASLDKFSQISKKYFFFQFQSLCWGIMALLAIIGHGSCVLWFESDTFLVSMQHMYFQGNLISTRATIVPETDLLVFRLI